MHTDRQHRALEGRTEEPEGWLRVVHVVGERGIGGGRQRLKWNRTREATSGQWRHGSGGNGVGWGRCVAAGGEGEKGAPALEGVEEEVSGSMS